MATQPPRRWSDLSGGESHEGGPEAGGALDPLPRRAETIAQAESPLLDAGLRLCLQPYALSSGNSIVPLVDGTETYTAMLQAIESAQRSIDLETYIWEGDTTGRRFADALEAKARAGLRVRVVADGAGAWAGGSLFARMSAAGVHFAFFHPMSPWRQRWGWSVRDHRKLLLTDGKTAFVGGINLGNEYAPIDQGGAGWHDIHARVEGPVTRALNRLFDDAFRYASGERGRGWLLLREPRTRTRTPASLGAAGEPPAPNPGHDPMSPTDLEHAGSARLQALAVGRRKDRRFIQRHQQYAVAMARTRVSIFNAYFIPNKSWRRTLSKAARRGVKVRILVPRTNDIPAVHYASRFTYQALLDAGVRIYEYLPTMLHAKAMVVDGEWCTIGSYNLDQRSLMYNWEIAIAGLDQPACARLEGQFESDLLRSREIDPILWRKRGFLERAKEQFFYFFRLLL